MGSNCQKCKDSFEKKELIYSQNNNQLKKKQKNHPSQVLHYCFPQKQQMERIRTKLQIEQEKNLPIQPTNPGSSIESLSDEESHHNTKQHNSCPTGREYHNIDDLFPSISLIRSTKNIDEILLSSKKLLIKKKQKGIIKNSLLNEFSKSHKSQRTIKSVRFLISASMIRVKGSSVKTKSLCRYRSSRRHDTSTVISNSNQSRQFQICL